MYIRLTCVRVKRNTRSLIAHEYALHSHQCKTKQLLHRRWRRCLHVHVIESIKGRAPAALERIRAARSPAATYDGTEVLWKVRCCAAESSSPVLRFVRCATLSMHPLWNSAVTLSNGAFDRVKAAPMSRSPTCFLIPTLLLYFPLKTIYKVSNKDACCAPPRAASSELQAPSVSFDDRERKATLTDKLRTSSHIV